MALQFFAAQQESFKKKGGKNLSDAKITPNSDILC